MIGRAFLLLLIASPALAGACVENCTTVHKDPVAVTHSACEVKLRMAIDMLTASQAEVAYLKEMPGRTRNSAGVCGRWK